MKKIEGKNVELTKNSKRKQKKTKKKNIFWLQYEDYGVEYDQYDEHYDDVGRGGGQGNYIQSEVKKFLQYFYEIFTKGDSFELTKLYEQTFPKLTESFFKTQPWPEVEELLSFLPDDNSLFFIIYKELYFRHIYARVRGGPSIEQRYIPQAFCSNDLEKGTQGF